jgi:CRP/FNR family transcriptional regulator, cyclic AMP receptor protein
VSALPPAEKNVNPITNLGRQLFRPESYPDGSADAVLETVNRLSWQRGHLVVARVLASDNRQQALFEKQGYICAGFQPFKHLQQVREGVLFYVLISQPALVTRLPLSESLPDVSELAAFVLGNLKIASPLAVRDGVTGYSLQSELKYHEATAEDFDLWRQHAQVVNPQREISGGYNLGWGILRLAVQSPIRAFLGQREDKIVAGLAHVYDEQDRCLRIVDSFATDDLSMGAMLHQILKMAQEQFNAVTVEVDVLMTAPRLLKSAEQLGFVPVAYLPAFFFENGRCADVVKLVKLNLLYVLENTSPTAHAARMVEIVDQNFQDQKVGVAIINLLRSLAFFEGLGDGELRKIARLFTQKLFRPGERVFARGDSGNEVYVVMRGEVDILLDDRSKPVASMRAGQIFGEQAFLDSTTRVASAVVSQPSILLVVQRAAFNKLVQNEPHLGMLVMRNIAIELSKKLRRADVDLLATNALRAG